MRITALLLKQARKGPAMGMTYLFLFNEIYLIFPVSYFPKAILPHCHPQKFRVSIFQHTFANTPQTE
jgi:hypothetical protein